MPDERRNEEHESRAAMAGETQTREPRVEDLDVPESEGDAVQGGAVMVDNGKETVTKIISWTSPTNEKL